MSDDGPRLEDPDGIALLGEVLRAAGFTPEGVNDALATGGEFVREPSEVPRYLRRLAPDAPLSALIKLFLLDVAIPEDEAARVLAPLALRRAQDLGLLQLRDGEARAAFNLVPAGELVLASDHYEPGGGRADHVLGLSISTRALGVLTVRLPVGAALDLGTGSGVHALSAAGYAERVVATDLNPRAVRFARFNALLNNVSNVEVREGSLFDPVEGETFDLVVSNPPYVISPAMDYAYRDGGLEGDSFSEILVRRLPEFLNEGGFGTVLVEWTHATGEEWSEPLRRWLDGSGCDAILLHYATDDPLTYAAKWNADVRPDRTAYDAALARWLAYYERLGIETLSWGAVVMRRRSGDNWIRAYSPPVRIGTASEHLLRMFEARDHLGSLAPGRGLLGSVFSLADDHLFEHAFVAAGGATVPRSTTVRLEQGLRFEVELEPRTLRLLTLLDGQAPLGRALEQLAAELVEEGEPEALAAESLPGLVRLVELGIVVPAH